MSRSSASTLVTLADEKAAIAMLEHAFRHVGTRALKDVQLGDITQHFADYRALSTTPPSDAGSTTPSGGEGVWPDIGNDPLKGPRPDDRHEAAYEAVRAAYVKQQSGVPDQTALVWRWHLGALLERHVRLRAILARDVTAPSPDASPDSGEYQRGLAEGARLVREYAASGNSGDLEALAVLILNQAAPDCAGIEKHWDGTR